VTTIRAKALNLAIVCLAVSAVAAVLAFVMHHASDESVGWLDPLSSVGLLAGGVFGLLAPRDLPREQRLAFAFCVFVGVAALVRWLV
jgi:hypothetical protein